MKSRWRGNRYGLWGGLLVLVMGTTSDLQAQEGIPALVPEPESAAREAGDASVSPQTPVPDADTGGTSILDLDIDQLGKVPARVPTVFDTVVTSVTANKSTVGKSPAAVFVITNEMIRRSGATSIPETFRMVPGMQVARVGASKWAVSARGFNQQFSTKLLVLVDGRSVYTPFFAGVYWETQDLVLQDVDHIEVIRGPGATVWGANAVNGVINIITKTAGNTQGALVSAGGGDQDQAITAARFGGEIGTDGKYRVYVKQTDRAAGFGPLGSAPSDDWRTVRGGFRADWDDPGRQDLFTLQGDIYFGVIGEHSVFAESTPPYDATPPHDGHIGGGNLLGRWTHIVDEDNTYSVQAYYDRTDRFDTEFNLAIDVFDGQFQQNLKHSAGHVVTWGAGYRLISDDIRGTIPTAATNPQSRTYDQASVFLQEETPLFRNDLKWIVGSKFLYYNFTGFEYQPSSRVLWEIDDKQVLWGAVSRAVRTPSRSEEDLALMVLNTAPIDSFLSFQGGGRALTSEELLSYEVGYRKQVSDALSFELATFYNVYRHLISSAITGFIPGAPPTTLSRFQNPQNADAYGFELNGSWDVRESWRLQAWYSFMRIQLDGPAGLEASIPNANPRNQMYLMSSWDLLRNLEFDLMARYVDDLPAYNVPSYATLDARLGWRPRQNWEFSVIGQNLLAPHHLESSGFATANSAVNRGVYAQVVWRH